MARIKKEDIDTPIKRKNFYRKAISVLHSRRELLALSQRLSGLQSEWLGIRGLVIATLSRTKWDATEVEIKIEWVSELEKAGLIEIFPTPQLPDTQPKAYYVAKLTDYSIEEAYQIIERL